MQVTVPRQGVVRQLPSQQIAPATQRTRLGCIDTVAGMVQEVKRDMLKKENLKVKLTQKLQQSKEQLECCRNQTSDQEEASGRLSGTINRNEKQLAELSCDMKDYEAEVAAFEAGPYSLYTTLAAQTTAQLSTYEADLKLQRDTLASTLMPQLQSLREEYAQAQTKIEDVNKEHQQFETERRNLQVMEKDLTTQLEEQNTDRECLEADLKKREDELRQTEEALVALEADVEATAQIIASNATMLLERAAHTQGQLEECIAHTATTQQSVAEMKKSNETLLISLAEQREGFDRTELALTTTLKCIEQTNSELQSLWEEEERRGRHFATVIQPAEEATRVEHARVTAELHAQQQQVEAAQVWKEKIRVGETELEDLRASVKSLSAQVEHATTEQQMRSELQAAKANRDSLLATLAECKDVQSIFQKDMEGLPPLPEGVAHKGSRVEELVVQLKDDLSVLLEYSSGMAAERATLDGHLQTMIPQAADIATLTQRLDVCAAKTAAAHTAAATLQAAGSRDFSAQEEEEMERAVAVKLEEQYADSDALNNREISHLQFRLQETSDGASKSKLAAMQELHDDELDDLRAQIRTAELRWSKTLPVRTSDSSKAQASSSKLAVKTSLPGPHRSRGGPDVPCSRKGQPSKARVESAIAWSLDSQNSVFDFDFDADVDATRVDGFSQRRTEGSDSSMNITSHTGTQLMDVSSLQASLPVVSRSDSVAKRGVKTTAKPKAKALEPRLQTTHLESMSELSPIGSANSSFHSTHSSSSADQFLLGFSSKKRLQQGGPARTNPQTITREGETTPPPTLKLSQKSSVPGAPTKKPKMLPSHPLSTQSASTVNFGPLSGGNKNTSAAVGTKAKAKQQTKPKSTAAASPGDWFFDDQHALF